ncbi:SPOR domain-containing protein [Thermodesulfatator atlanticus]|uniref:SPOR domain-containing protein n=1 Tax=Thermodesulfatator atlanticus TaxID=501497 RepID=UPI0003B6BBD9|nr:SPOR domain-containing protein [Thermodesulfatator atlanticus]
MAKKTKTKRFQFQLGWPGLIFTFGLLICLFLWMFVLGFYFGQKMMGSRIASMESPVSQKALSEKKIEPPPVYEEVKPPPLVKELAPEKTPKETLPEQEEETKPEEKTAKVETSPLATKPAPKKQLTKTATKKERPQDSKKPKQPETFYAVQVASLRSEKDAEKYARYLRDRGYDALVKRVTLPQKGTWYRVYVGRFKSLAEARAFGEKLKAREKLKAFYIQKITVP